MATRPRAKLTTGPRRCIRRLEKGSIWRLRYELAMAAKNGRGLPMTVNKANNDADYDANGRGKHERADRMA